MSNKIEVPQHILVPARIAAIGLDRLSHGIELQDDLPPVSTERLIAAFTTGVSLTRAHGITRGRVRYHTDLLDLGDEGTIQLIGEQPLEGFASLEIQSYPPRDAVPGERDFTIVELTGSVVDKGTKNFRIDSLSELKLNEDIAESRLHERISRYVVPLVNFAEVALPRLRQ